MAPFCKMSSRYLFPLQIALQERPAAPGKAEALGDGLDSDSIVLRLIEWIAMLAARNDAEPMVQALQELADHPAYLHHVSRRLEEVGDGGSVWTELWKELTARIERHTDLCEQIEFAMAWAQILPQLPVAFQKWPKGRSLVKELHVGSNHLAEPPRQGDPFEFDPVTWKNRQSMPDAAAQMARQVLSMQSNLEWRSQCRDLSRDQRNGIERRIKQLGEGHPKYKLLEKIRDLPGWKRGDTTKFLHAFEETVDNIGEDQSLLSYAQWVLYDYLLIDWWREFLQPPEILKRCCQVQAWRISRSKKA
jgi:hypothetical protein